MTSGRSHTVDISAFLKPDALDTKLSLSSTTSIAETLNAIKTATSIVSGGEVDDSARLPGNFDAGTSSFTPLPPRAFDEALRDVDVPAQPQQTNKRKRAAESKKDDTKNKKPAKKSRASESKTVARPKKSKAKAAANVINADTGASSSSSLASAENGNGTESKTQSSDTSILPVPSCCAVTPNTSNPVNPPLRRSTRERKKPMCLVVSADDDQESYTYEEYNSDEVERRFREHAYESEDDYKNAVKKEKMNEEQRIEDDDEFDEKAAQEAEKDRTASDEDEEFRPDNPDDKSEEEPSVHSDDDEDDDSEAEYIQKTTRHYETGSDTSENDDDEDGEGEDDDDNQLGTSPTEEEEEEEAESVDQNSTATTPATIDQTTVQLTTVSASSAPDPA